MLTECRYCRSEFDSPHASVGYCTESCATQAYLLHQREEHWANCEVKHLRQFSRPLEELYTQNLDAWTYAETWDRTRNIYLYGGEGIGKSALCKYLMCKDVERGRDVQMPAMTMVQQCAYNDRAMEAVCSRLVRCSTLLLDDIHDSCLTDKGYAVLRYVLDIRHESHRRTLVTANISPEDMMRRIDGLCGGGYGLQMLRRLAPCKKFEMSGKSYRQQMNREIFE